MVWKKLKRWSDFNNSEKLVNRFEKGHATRRLFDKKTLREKPTWVNVQCNMLKISWDYCLKSRFYDTMLLCWYFIQLNHVTIRCIIHQLTTWWCHLILTIRVDWFPIKQLSGFKLQREAIFLVISLKMNAQIKTYLVKQYMSFLKVLKIMSLQRNMVMEKKYQFVIPQIWIWEAFVTCPFQWRIIFLLDIILTNSEYRRYPKKTI